MSIDKQHPCRKSAITNEIAAALTCEQIEILLNRSFGPHPHVGISHEGDSGKPTRIDWGRIIRAQVKKAEGGDVLAAMFLIEHRWGEARERIEGDGDESEDED